SSTPCRSGARTDRGSAPAAPCEGPARARLLGPLGALVPAINSLPAALGAMGMVGARGALPALYEVLDACPMRNHRTAQRRAGFDAQQLVLVPDRRRPLEKPLPV